MSDRRDPRASSRVSRALRQVPLRRAPPSLEQGARGDRPQGGVCPGGAEALRAGRARRGWLRHDVRRAHRRSLLATALGAGRRVGGRGAGGRLVAAVGQIGGRSSTWGSSEGRSCGRVDPCSGWAGRERCCIRRCSGSVRSRTARCTSILRLQVTFIMKTLENSLFGSPSVIAPRGRGGAFQAGADPEPAAESAPRAPCGDSRRLMKISDACANRADSDAGRDARDRRDAADGDDDDDTDTRRRAGTAEM